ncbi:MAG: NEW3 domain-containing protein, partial [Thermoplasmata archaeon]
TGEVITTSAEADGSFHLGGLFAGNYTVVAEAGELRSLPQRLALQGSRPTPLDLRVEPLGELTGRTLVSFVPTAHVSVTLQRRGEAQGLMITSDATARFAVDLPLGTYDVYALHFTGGRNYGFLGTVVVEPGGQEVSLDLLPAHRIDGAVERDGREVTNATVTFETGAGALHAVATGNGGSFVTFLPGGLYQTVALNTTGQRVTSLAVDGPTQVTFTLSTALATPGRVFRDLNGNGTHDAGEGLPGVEIRISSDSTPAFSVLAGEEGAFAVPLVADVSYLWTIEEEGFEPKTVGPLRPSGLGALAPIELVALNVSVSGGLTTSDLLDLAGLNVTLVAIGHGGISTNGTTGTGGAWTVLLQPGIYQLLVDDEGPPWNGSRRIQTEAEGELRVPVGGGISPIALPVVERLRVQGFLTSGVPLGAAVLFEGPDRAFVATDEPYLIFLRRGTYDVSGAADAAAPRALLQVLTVTDPIDFNATFESATRLGGTLRVEDEVVPQDVAIAFTRVADGARVVVPSDGAGGYTTVLVPGTYHAAAAWVGVDRLDGVNRFVRYDLDQTVVLTNDTQIDLLFTRELDTRLVELSVLLGSQLVSAQVSFEAANETAVDTVTFAPGGLPSMIALAPGLYNVYAFRGIGNSAALTTIEVHPDDATTLTIALEAGNRVFGVVTLSDGTRRATELQFTSLAGRATFATNAQGEYEVFLPAGSYGVLATSERDEGGVMVEYRFEESLELTDSLLINPLLTRVDVRTVGVAWDPEQRALIAPGETVVYTVTVTNTGNQADTFTLSGGPQGWSFSFSPSRVTLPFGAGNEATVTVQITAPADAKVASGTLTLVARSQADPAVATTEIVEVDIIQFRGLSLGLSEDPPVLREGALVYQIDVRNDGNGPDAFDLLLTNPEALAAQGWETELIFEDQTSPEVILGISVQPGTSRSVTLRLNATDRVSTSTASFVAFSQEVREVESSFDLAVGFPTLEIPQSQLGVEGKNTRLGVPEFPVLLYGVLAAAAVGVVVLFLTYGRRRRRR